MPAASDSEYYPGPEHSGSVTELQSSLESFRTIQRLAHSLKISELRILLALAAYPDGLTTIELDRQTGVYRDTLRGALRSLSSQGFIARAEVKRRNQSVRWHLRLGADGGLR